MTRIGRVLRGIGVSAAVWAVVVPVAYVVIQSVVSMLGGASPPERAWRGLLIEMTIRGALHGMVFGSILAIAGRRRTLATIGAVKVAAIGAVAGSVGPLLSVSWILWHKGLDTGIFGSSAILGAALPIVVGSAIGAAWASLALRIGRRAPDSAALDDTELLALSVGAFDDTELVVVPTRELIER